LPGSGFSSHARGVSGDGHTIVGWSSTNNGDSAFRWTMESGIVGLGGLPNGDGASNARAISADGSTIVGWAPNDLGTEAFRWTAEAGMVGLGDLPGGNYMGAAFAVSGDGSVIVGQSDSSFGMSESFIWDDAHGMRRLRDVLVGEYGLNLDGWTLSTETTGISDDGLTIVGRGVNADGQAEAWIAHIPEPNVGLLVLGGFLLLCSHRRFARNPS